MSRLGVVAALPAEARALGFSKMDPAGALATLSDGSRLAVSGMGPPAAERAAERLLQGGCSALLCFGLAGGLDPVLRPGARLVPRAVRGTDGGRWPTDEAWRAHLVARLEADGPVEQGELLSCSQPLASTADKARAHAESGVVAVDMESAAVAGVALKAGVPFLVVRVVVDAAQDALPRAVAAASAGGTLRVGRLLTGLLRDPGEIGALLTLAGRYRVAMRALRRVARSGPLAP